MPSIFLTEAANDEYAAALEWYAEQSRRAADGLRTAFRQAVAKIEQFPEAHPLCDERHRCCLIGKYPYALIYRIVGDQIRVVAIYHTRQIPPDWESRD